MPCQKEFSTFTGYVSHIFRNDNITYAYTSKFSKDVSFLKLWTHISLYTTNLSFTTPIQLIRIIRDLSSLNGGKFFHVGLYFLFVYEGLFSHR